MVFFLVFFIFKQIFRKKNQMILLIIKLFEYHIEKSIIYSLDNITFFSKSILFLAEKLPGQY